MRFRRRHPSERALRKWGQLTPELRELIIRAARSVAKDAVQEIMEGQGLPFYTNPSDRPIQSATPAQIQAAQVAIAQATHDLANLDLTDAERSVYHQMIKNAGGLLGDTCES